jgi:hypothetical protein
MMRWTSGGTSRQLVQQSFIVVRYVCGKQKYNRTVFLMWALSVADEQNWLLGVLESALASLPGTIKRGCRALT